MRKNKERKVEVGVGVGTFFFPFRSMFIVFEMIHQVLSELGKVTHELKEVREPAL